MMKTTTIAATTIFALLLIYLFPKQTISPGDLSGGHKNLENDCMKCHTVFLGTPGEKCVICHKPSEIGIITTAGIKIEKSPGQGKASFHHLFSEDSCLTCHPDHKGRNISKRDRQFSHALFKGKDIHRCRTCHQGPGDNVHSNSNKECNTCHALDRWKPATLDHARYFRFDKHHGPDCLTCHRDNNYSAYTCYDCHEHSPGKIQEEHREEGIRNYHDCAACHPSGNEDDTRRFSDPRRYEESFRDSSERGVHNRQEGYRESGYNYYNRDDDYDHDEDHDRRDRDDDDDDDHDRRGNYDDD